MSPEDKRGKLTLSIPREVIEAARESLGGEISARVSAFLAREVRKARKGER